MKTLIIRIKNHDDACVEEKQLLVNRIKEQWGDTDMKILIAFGDMDFYTNDPEFRLLEPNLIVSDRIK